MIIGINGYIGSGKDTVGKIIQYLTITNIPQGYTLDKFINRMYTTEYPFTLIPTWQIRKYADKLKQIASILTGIPQEKFEDQEFKKTFLDKEWDKSVALDRESMLQENKYWEEKPMSIREFLQKLGTDAIRDGLHPNTWVNALMSDYKPLMSASYYIMDLGASDVQREKIGKTIPIEFPNWIITDCRFPNEAQAIKDREGIVIRVNRNERIGKSTIDIMKPYSDYVNYGIPIPERHTSETSLDNWNFDYIIENNSTIEELIEKVRNILKQFNIIM